MVSSAEINFIKRHSANMLRNTTDKKKISRGETGKVGPSEAPTPPSPIKKTKGQGFKDVAGMEVQKALINEAFITPILNPQLAKLFNVKPPSLMLYGPAGCGKTYFAERIAEEMGVSFIKISPSDLASQYIHGTQELIRETFKKAKEKAPVVVFFDEFDAIAPKRVASPTHQHSNGEVNEILCQFNNANELGIYIIVATNHPDMIDDAVLRAGRIDEKIYIDMPDSSTRESLFRYELSKTYADNQIDYTALAQRTQGYNCGDITYIVEVASRKKLNESAHSGDRHPVPIDMELLFDIISRQTPSVTECELKGYEEQKRRFSSNTKTRQHSGIGFA